MNTNKLVRNFVATAIGSCWAIVFTALAPQAFAGGDIFDGYIQINGTWYNVGGVNDGRNKPSGSANASVRTTLNNAGFGTQTFGSFNLTGFQINGWTSDGTWVTNNGANYKVWKSGDSEPNYINFWNNGSFSYYEGGDYYSQATAQSTAIIGSTFINGDTYNLKVQTFTGLGGNNAGPKWYENSTTFVVNGARQLVTGAGNTSQSGAYNTSAAGGVVKQGSGSLTLAYDSSDVASGQKGDIYIDEGTVAVNPNATVSGNNALGGANTTIRLGQETGGASAKLALADSDGGLSISRNIVVRAGSTGTKTVSAENTQGTNTYSGVMYLNDDVTLSAASGGTLDISGQLDDGVDVGGDDVFIGGAGTVRFSGSANNQNIVSYTVLNGARLLLAKSSADAIQSVLTINSGGTVEFAASNQFGSGADIFNNGTLATGSGNFSDSFDALESSGDITGNGTLTALSYTLSGGTVSANLGSGTLNITGNATLNGSSGANTVAITGGNLTLGSGANRLSSGADVTISANRSLSIASDQTLASIKETGTSNGGTVTIGNGATLTIDGANKGNLFQNTISGDGSLTLAASGNTVLSLYGGANTLGGTFTISGGELGGSSTLTAANYALNGGTVTANLGAGTATASTGTTALGGTLGATTVNISGGTLNLGANDRLANGATVSVSSGALGMGTRTDTITTLNVSGGSVTGSTGNKLTAGTYNLTGGTVGANLGAGTLNANSGSATLNGTADATTVNVGGGTLGLGSAGRLASGAAVTVSNSGTLNIAGSETVSSLTLNGGTLGGSGNTLTASSYSLDGGTVTANLGAGVATATSGTTALNGNLGGSLAANGGTVNVGGTIGGNVSIGGGTVNLNSADRIANTAVLTLSSGTLGLGANSDQVASLAMLGGSISGSGTLTASTYTFSGSGDMTVDAGLGAGALTKTGAGTLLINSGKTANVTSSSIEGGKLVVSGTLAGTTTVTNGATIAGGGTVGTLNIAGGGILGPGNSPGTLTANSGASWAQGGSYDWEIFSLTDVPGTSWDWLQVTSGSLDLNGITGAGGFTINLITLSGLNTQGSLASFSPTATYTNWLIASAPTITGFVASEFNLNSSLFVGATGTFGIEQRAYGGGQGLFVTYNGGGGAPIPEPGTWAAAALLAGAAGYVRWRRRKSAEPRA